MKSLTPLQAFFEALTESGLAFDEHGVCTYLHDQAERRVPMAEAVIASARKACRTYIMAEDLRAGLVAAGNSRDEIPILQHTESGDTASSSADAPFHHPLMWGAHRPGKSFVN